MYVYLSIPSIVGLPFFLLSVVMASGKPRKTMNAKKNKKSNREKRTTLRVIRKTVIRCINIFYPAILASVLMYKFLEVYTFNGYFNGYVLKLALFLFMFFFAYILVLFVWFTMAIIALLLLEVFYEQPMSPSPEEDCFPFPASLLFNEYIFVFVFTCSYCVYMYILEKDYLNIYLNKKNNGREELVVYKLTVEFLPKLLKRLIKLNVKSGV